MILSDRDIQTLIKKRELIFKPSLSPKQIGPASIDLKLGPEFKVFHTSRVSLLDPKQGLPKDFMDTHILKGDEPFILHPSDFVLASTVEYIAVPNGYIVRAEGKSTLARMGILVHTAGFVDPGFEGNITLEISNQSDLAVALYAGMYICQIAVEKMSSPADVPYNKRKTSLYAGSKGTIEAKPKNLFE
ncbi:dCTP deaminase [Candidatus Giovannonibacteria bacterium]|nr:dCTP deaminase [Candidatus Giovannonibacteria bacterium]